LTALASSCDRAAREQFEFLDEDFTSSFAITPTRIGGSSFVVVIVRAFVVARSREVAWIDVVSSRHDECNTEMHTNKEESDEDPDDE
jgi:hypothetical protein